MVQWWLLVFLSLCSLSHGLNPGVIGRITQKGIDYGRQIGLIAVQDKLKTLHIPDISGSEKVSPIGKVEYSISGMRIVNLGLPQSAVGFAAGTGISLSITNAFIQINGNWHVKYLRFIKDHGTFDLSLSGITISATIGVTHDETGRPTVWPAGCSANVASANVKFHGGASWLYNLFKQSIDKALRNALNSQLCTVVSGAIESIKPHLKTLNVLVRVDHFAEVDYSLVLPPSITKSYIDLGVKGEFYNIGQHREPPFSAPSFSLPNEASNMLYIGLSAFTINSAAFVYNNAGVLQINVTDEMIPKSSPVHLNTKTLGLFVPEVARRYPNMPVILNVRATQQPSANIQPNNVTLQSIASMSAYAVQANSTLAPLFDLSVVASVSLNFNISGLRLVGSLSLDDVQISLQKSFVGPFQVASLNNIIQFTLKAVVVPMLNDLLTTGFPLPTIEKLRLVGPHIKILKDFILIGTDLQYEQDGSTAAYLRR
ncbi:bactericidal permeability-increasing protein-like [Erpetoichthys calabaricus]|uniref:Bactericidal permeability-increasing protein n=1 Tax=Erpetoichthys calabaricus TaxID=27687 RepID=A0A8C4SMR0_ERPCA|nr:bactericidal permeability-increasing protein-like [Erpetoichthys calabaricus]XP_028667953.1 bactericidal permeability-increasing protein-like [Erpetoichthys calabaricus]